MTANEELIELGKQQAILKENIHKVKRAANKELRQEHRTLIRVFDIIFVLMILANIGALILTNALAIKAKPDQQLTELNPIAAEVYDYVPAIEVHPLEKVMGAIIAFYFHIIAYFIMIVIWLYIRFYSTYRKKLYQGIGLILFWGVALFLDFFNNLGLWIGRVIWGG